MSRGWLAIAAAAMVLAIAVRPAARQEQLPTFRASADLVAVDVSVRRAGRPVTGLKLEDFEITDDAVKQTIIDMSYGKLPIDVTIALDVSASVTGAVLDDLRRSVQQLARDLQPADRLKLVTFNMRVKRVMDFAADPAAGLAAVRQSAGSGSTAVLDTIAVALASDAPPDRRQLVMLFTDGQDSASVTDPRTLLDLARRTTPTIGVVLAMPGSLPFMVTPGRLPMTSGPVQTASGVAVLLATRQIYEQLARETGGIVVSTSTGSVAPTLRRVLDEFRSSYVLHFTPRGVNRDGLHTLVVRVPKSNDVQVRARSSYAWR